MPEEFLPKDMGESSPEDFSTDEFVTVFKSQTASAGVEAEAIHGLLTSASLKSLIVRENVPELPTGWVEVKVLSSEEQEALDLIESAQQTGGPTGREDSK